MPNLDVTPENVLQSQNTLRNSEKEPAPQETFEHFANEWKNKCVLGGGLTESQINSDISILKHHLIPFFEKYSLSEISIRLLDNYKAQKRTQEHQYGIGYSAKSINNHLSVLHRMFEKAIEYELCDKNPVNKRAWMKPEKTSEDSQNFWNQTDERKAIVALNQWKELYPQKRLVVLLQVMTGIRFSEIRSLKICDVDLQVPGIWIRRSMARKKLGTPKNKRARFHVIPRGLAEELEVWVKDKPEDAWLFTGSRSQVLANNSLNRWYQKLAELAGIRKISSHGARHTTGSSYAVMGVGQKMIAKLLGHVTTHATERYTHIQVNETQPLVEERWARLLSKL